MSFFFETHFKPGDKYLEWTVY